VISKCELLPRGTPYDKHLTAQDLAPSTRLRKLGKANPTLADLGELLMFQQDTEVPPESAQLSGATRQVSEDA
jgi:hypothetical protein